MAAPHYQSTHEIVIAATLWLMHRYQKTGCKKISRLVEQHLRWMQAGPASPQLADACARLSFEWRAVSCTPPDTHTAAPQPALH